MNVTYKFSMSFIIADVFSMPFEEMRSHFDGINTAGLLKKSQKVSVMAKKKRIFLT